MNRTLLRLGCAAFLVLFRVQGAEPVVVRFAHNQLEPSVVAAFDQVAQSYMASRPGVRIEQTLVPARVYRSWVRTQLIGGTAPQLIELTLPVTQDLVARFFLPLSSIVEERNRYNEGTNLAGASWRSTFWDGLNTKPNYSVVLAQHYGIPNTLLTRRVLYNRDQLRRITGAEEVPRTLAQFLAFAERAAAAGREEANVALVTHAEHVESLLEHCISAATHELKLKLDPTRRRTGWDFEPAQGYLTGEWSLRSPETTAGLSAFQRIAQFLPLGANQFNPQDASFMFLQKRASALIATSAEAAVLRELAPFPIAVGPLPLPDREDGELGQFFAHRLSEADLRSSGSFGVVRGAPHTDVALDFLRWMSSQSTHRQFVQASGWNPVVRGVPPRPGGEAFVPSLAGVPAGMRLMLFSDETGQLVRTNLHRLIGPRSSVADFVGAIEPGYAEALRRGWTRNQSIEARNIIRLDGSIAAAWFGVDRAESTERAEALSDQRIDLELTQKWTEFAEQTGYRILAKPKPEGNR